MATGNQFLFIAAPGEMLGLASAVLAVDVLLVDIHFNAVNVSERG